MPIVAIELQEPGTQDVRVFTPNNVWLEVWQVRLLGSLSKPDLLRTPLRPLSLRTSQVCHELNSLVYGIKSGICAGGTAGQGGVLDAGLGNAPVGFPFRRDACSHGTICHCHPPPAQRLAPCKDSFVPIADPLSFEFFSLLCCTRIAHLRGLLNIHRQTLVMLSQCLECRLLFHNHCKSLLCGRSFRVC